MPVVTINPNIKVEQDTLLKDLSLLCAKLLSKPESYLMVPINDQQKLAFARANEAAA